MHPLHTGVPDKNQVTQNKANGLTVASTPNFNLYEKCFAGSKVIDTLSVEDLMHLHLRGYWENQIEKVRSFPYKSSDQLKAKKNLPAWKPHKNSKGSHSGILVFDIDLGHNKSTDFIKLKEKLCRNEYAHLVCDSSSGKGLYFVIKAEVTKETHKEVYQGIKVELEKQYSIQIDDAAIAVSFDANRFVSSDPNLYFNPTSFTRIYKAPTLSQSRPKQSQSKPGLSQGQKTIQQIQYSQANDFAKGMLIYHLLKNENKSITASYEEWIRTGFACINSFSEDQANELIHKLSSLDSNYTESETNKKIGQLRKRAFVHPEESKLKFASIIYAAKEKGLKLIYEPHMMNRAHPLNSFMPGKSGSTKQLQARILCEIDYFASLENENHKYGEYTRINSNAISDAIGTSRSTVSRHIKTLAEKGFIELIQPLLANKNTSYFAKLSHASIEAQRLLSALKNSFSFYSIALCNLHLNDLHFFSSSSDSLNKINKREEQASFNPSLSLKDENESLEPVPESSFSPVQTDGNKPRENRIKAMSVDRAKDKPRKNRVIKPYPEEIRRKYQSLLASVYSISGERIDSKVLQREFVIVHGNLEEILKYLPAFLKYRAVSELFFYLKDRKWLEYARKAKPVPMPRNQGEAQALNSKYCIADYVLKHKYLDCLILNGKSNPSKVPEGISYQIGQRFFVNDDFQQREISKGMISSNTHLRQNSS